MSRVYQFPKNTRTPVPPAVYAVPEQDDVTFGFSFDFQGEWHRAVLILSERNIRPSVVLDHEVTFSDLGIGAAIAQYLKQDQQAAIVLSELALKAAKDNRNFCMLGDIPERYRGYVWTLNPGDILKISALVRIRLGRIINKPLRQRLFFDV